MITHVQCRMCYAKKRPVTGWTDPFADPWYLPDSSMSGYYASATEAEQALDDFKAKCSANNTSKRKAVFKEWKTNVTDTYTVAGAARELSGKLFKQYLEENGLHGISINI